MGIASSVCGFFALGFVLALPVALIVRAVGAVRSSINNGADVRC